MTLSDGDRLKAKQKLRLGILRLLYKRHIDNISGSRAVHYNDIKQIFDNTDEEIRQELKYLSDESLIESVTHIQMSITHLGVKEVEHAIEFPDERTKYFPQGVVQYYYGPVAVVQNGKNTVVTKH
jgi:repressor of nif and glnA expression